MRQDDDGARPFWTRAPSSSRCESAARQPPHVIGLTVPCRAGPWSQAGTVQSRTWVSFGQGETSALACSARPIFPVPARSAASRLHWAGEQGWPQWGAEPTTRSSHKKMGSRAGQRCATRWHTDTPSLSVGLTRPRSTGLGQYWWPTTRLSICVETLVHLIRMKFDKSVMHTAISLENPKGTSRKRAAQSVQWNILNLTDVSSF
jgi:hypothetical protein